MGNDLTRKHEIVLLAGTRPEAIKMIPIYRELQRSESLHPFFLSTGQHREMLDQVFQSFDFQPDDDLRLMQASQTLPDLTARAIVAITDFLRKRKPSAVLVQGDTTTVLAGALAAAYERIPIGHVEAGLRTHDMNSPFPEELNRRLTTPLCRWLFAPTARSRENLIREAIESDRIFVTGNSVIDALLWIRQKVRASSEAIEQRCARLAIPEAFAKEYLASTQPSPLVVVTGHRRESFGGGFESICHAILRIVRENPQLGVLYPVHLNPNVREPVMRLLTGQPRIALIEPVAYEDFVFLMDRAALLLSDSGGVQEEAPSLGKPVLVMRETTERPEGIDAGTCVLVGTNPDRISSEVSELLHSQDEYSRRSQLRNPYGDGKTSQRIREILESSLLR